MLIITQWQTVQFGSWRELSSSGIVLGRILSKGPSHQRAVSWSSPRPIRRSGCASWPMRRHEVTSPTEAGNRIQMSPNTLQSMWPSINIFYELLTEIKPLAGKYLNIRERLLHPLSKRIVRMSLGNFVSWEKINKLGFSRGVEVG